MIISNKYSSKARNTFRTMNKSMLMAPFNFETNNPAIMAHKTIRTHHKNAY